VGRTIDRYGGRPVLAVGCLLLAFGLAILGAAPSLAVFIGGWLVLGVGMGAGLYEAAFATLGRLYGRSARSAITALTLWGGFASTVCWPLSAYLVAHIGWRSACLTHAVIQLGVCLPLTLLVVPHAGPRPEEAPVALPVRAPALTTAERRLFGRLALVLTLVAVTEAIVSFGLLTLLQARGLALAAAVSLGVLIGPSQVLSRLVELLSGGRHHPLWTMTAAVTLMAVGLVLLAAHIPVPALAVALYGAGIGIDSIARGTLPLALFGPARYAALVGRLARPSFVAQSFAPLLAALALARAGPDITLAGLGALAVANVLLVAELWRSARAAEQPVSFAREDGEVVIPPP
jgi:hypothetical protein